MENCNVPTYYPYGYYWPPTYSITYTPVLTDADVERIANKVFEKLAVYLDEGDSE